jgi:hypothetical protein
MERWGFQDIQSIVLGKDNSHYLDERRQKLNGFFLVVGERWSFLSVTVLVLFSFVLRKSEGWQYLDVAICGYEMITPAS